MSEPLYRTVMGEAYDHLPAVTRALHNPNPERRFVGRAQIRRGGHLLAKLVAGWLGFPKSGDGVPAEVTVRREADQEILTRCYGGHVFESLQFRSESADGPRLMERIGPITTRLRIEARQDGLNLHAERAYWRGLPLPRWLTPRVRASERAYGGAHLFDVAVSLPLIGPVIAYRGRLVERR